jgi:hypothetical protein
MLENLKKDGRISTDPRNNPCGLAIDSTEQEEEIISFCKT